MIQLLEFPSLLQLAIHLSWEVGHIPASARTLQSQLLGKQVYPEHVPGDHLGVLCPTRASI